MTPAAEAARPLVALHAVGRDFDVSKPWLNRVVERTPRQLLQAVDGLSLEILRGETVALVGESGCGKSTVARLIVGLYRAVSRAHRVRRQPPDRQRGVPGAREVRRRMQMIFQDPYASLNPRWSVADIVAEPIRAHGSRRRSPRRCAARVAELLTQVGLAPADGEKYPHEFSGGQRQRISIARALSSAPEFLICDEPTSALDVSVQAQILNLMKELQDRLGLTYLFISHNLAVVSQMATRVGVMYLGRLVELADAGSLFSPAAASLYPHAARRHSRSGDERPSAHAGGGRSGESARAPSRLHVSSALSARQSALPRASGPS